MERYTDRNANGQAMLILKKAFECSEDDEKRWNVDVMRWNLGEKKIVTVTGDAVEKFAAYEEAEEKGRLLRLPCNVGDVVFKPVTRYYKGMQRIDEPHIFTLVVEKIQITSDGITFSTKSCDSFTLEDIGNTIFMTQEEAEEKLKEIC